MAILGALAYTDKVTRLQEFSSAPGVVVTGLVFSYLPG